MKLVACPNCHAQYDLANFTGDVVSCRCGTAFPAAAPEAKDAAVRRCAACGALVGELDRTCAYCHAEIARRPEAAGPVCPECYARNPVGARHCTSCGIAFEPQPVRASADPLECPVCPGVRLAARNLGGIWVDECAMCLGLWAPGDAMDRLVERLRERRRREGAPPADLAHRDRRAAWQATVAYRKCPECGAQMQRKNFGRRSGVIVDWCGSHGTWLDANEMGDVAAFVLRGGLEAETPAEGGAEGPLPSDPKRVAAIAAAERILAEERAREASARNETALPGFGRGFRGIGDLIAHLLG